MRLRLTRFPGTAFHRPRAVLVGQFTLLLTVGGARLRVMGRR